MINAEIRKLNKIIPQDISGYDDEQLNETIGKQLREKGKTLSTAESCTGGYIAHLITLVPGSSEYFKGSIIAYANDTKESLLGVRHQSLIEFGAVSGQVVKEMAEGIRTKLNTDYAIATSGIAGPGGGTEEKPVGTTWIAIATREKTIAEHFLMGNHRERNISKTAASALNMLRKLMIE
jgi:nicotinamide-nucleotide amidase